MNAVQYLQARSKLDSEYRRKLESLNEVWVLFNGNQPLPEPIESHDDAVEYMRGTWRLITTQTIQNFPDKKQFTVREIEQAIRSENQKVDLAALSTFLKKMADSGEIQIVEPGRGRRATIYQKPKK